MGYETPPGKIDSAADSWRRRWTVPEVYASYEAALSYWDGHGDVIKGLTFVLHHHGDTEPRERLVILDWDHAILGGVMDSEVQAYLELFQTYTSYSQSRTGAHTVLKVSNCPAFGNLIHRPVGGCTVDVLCTNPVAVTGIPVEGFNLPVASIDYEELNGLPFFEYKPPLGQHTERPEWWDSDPLDSVPDGLKHHIPYMEQTPAIEGQGGSLVLFAAACHLARNGVVGREAEVLLRCVPAEPKFDDAQIQRVAECAFARVSADGEFDVPTPEFDILPGAPAKEEESEDGEEDREKLFGYNFLTANELLAKDLKLEYLVEGAFVVEGTLFIGGDQKTFKTGLAADLLVSLATEEPFLGRFPVKERRRCAMFTAEIGEVKAQLLLRAVAQSKGHQRIPGLDIVNEVPRFGVNRNAGVTGDAIKRLGLFLKTRRPEVVVFDPLYLAIIGGDAADMYGMGLVIDEMVKLCNKFGVWAIFCHHSKKTTSETEFRPMKLSDFYGTGPSQYARQWLLVAHSEPFRNGVANLFLTLGGSTQSREDVYSIKIDEGVTDEIADRRWDVIFDEEAECEEPTLTHERVVDELSGHPKGMTEAQLVVMLAADRQKTKLKQIIRDLIRAGRVDMRGSKYELAHGELFND